MEKQTKYSTSPGQFQFQSENRRGRDKINSVNKAKS